MPRKKEESMKRVCAVLGLALLMGCGNSDNNDCPRKDKSCGKGITTVETSAVQEVVSVKESVTPSN
jgi:hypothetical protein